MALTVKPYPFQAKGIDFAYKHYWVMCGDEQGLGKTLQALGLIDRVGGDRNVVVCPASLKKTWEHEINKFLPDYKDKIEILTYHAFTKAEPRALDCLIFDEAHYLKNHLTKRAQKAQEWCIGYSPRYLFLATGTPITNRVTEFFSCIYLLSCSPWNSNGEKWLGGYHAFCRNFTFVRRQFFGAKEVIRYEGLRNASQLKGLLRGKYYRRLAKNCLDLPKLVRKEVWLDDKKVDAELEKAWVAYEEGGHYSTLKAEVALAKTSFTAKYVQNILDEGERLLVYTDHRASAFRLEELLLKSDNRVGLITGGQPPKQRDKYIAQFKAGELDVLVLSIGAASVGLTLTESNNIVFNDIPWVPADLQQAEKRIHRIGQERNVFIHYCLSGATDKRIYETVVEKAKLLKKVTNVWKN